MRAKGLIKEERYNQDQEAYSSFFVQFSDNTSQEKQQEKQSIFLECHHELVKKKQFIHYTFVQIITNHRVFYTESKYDIV